MSGAELRIPVLDLIIIVAYLAGILAVGVLSTRKQKLTGDAYFLAGRSLGWVVIGAALFASNISTNHWWGWPPRVTTRASFGAISSGPRRSR